MNLKEVLSSIQKPILAIVLDESINRVDAVKAIEDAWQGKLTEVNTICEGLVAEKATNKINESKVAYEKEMKSDFDKLTGALTDRLEGFLGEAREYDQKENKGQIIATAKVEVMNEAMTSIVEALAKSSIIVDTDSKSQLDAIETKSKNFESRLNDVMNENIELKKTLKSQKFSNIFESVRNDLKLSDVQSTRLKMLGEGFANDEKADEKLRILGAHIAGAKIDESTKDKETSISDGELIVEDENATPSSGAIDDPLWAAFNNASA